MPGAKRKKADAQPGIDPRAFRAKLDKTTYYINSMETVKMGSIDEKQPTKEENQYLLTLRQCLQEDWDFMPVPNGLTLSPTYCLRQ